MAISEVCKYEVKEEFDVCIEKGMSRREASKWLAGVFSETLGREISPETIRKKDQRARNELGTNVPIENRTGSNWVSIITPDNWPICRQCKKDEVKKSNVYEIVEKGIAHWKPVKHGLCHRCAEKNARQEEIEKYNSQVQKAREEFEATPISQESDEFWNHIADELGELFSSSVFLKKVSRETWIKIDEVRTMFNEYVQLLEEQSTCPEPYT